MGSLRKRFKERSTTAFRYTILREEQIDLLSKHLGRGREGEGVRIQEFVAAFEDLDEKHGYANDKYGSGGGGEVEGPVAAAVGHDAVLKWQGSREHRGQLSRSLTARGFDYNGSAVFFSRKYSKCRNCTQKCH